MKKTITMAVFISLILGIAGSQAETVSPPASPPQSDIEKQYTKKIYTWIDGDGVQHFSNKRPPEGAQNVKMINPGSSPSPAETNPSEIKKKQDYDRMVEKARSETRELEKERKSKKAAATAEKKRQAEKIRNARVEAERKKLLNEIDAINARGLSPTFSQGMKNALIKKVREQIHQLEKDPETYFQHK